MIFASHSPRRRRCRLTFLQCFVAAAAANLGAAAAFTTGRRAPSPARSIGRSTCHSLTTKTNAATPPSQFRRRSALSSSSPPPSSSLPIVVRPLASSTSCDDGGGESSSSDDGNNNKLDAFLSRLTSSFPLLVLSSAILATLVPSSLLWVNAWEPLIPLMLSLVMLGTGTSLTSDDFTSALSKHPSAVPSGVLCQFGIMPLAASIVGRFAFLRTTTSIDPVLAGAAPSLFLGLVLVGCSPGGTASNLVSLIAGADVALSVMLTAASTILASAVTPLLVKLLVNAAGGSVAADIAISGWALCSATARVVLLPVALGMVLNKKAPQVAARCSRFAPPASAILVALICGGVVAQNAATSSLGAAAASSVATSHLFPRVLLSVLSLHLLGFAAGYLVPRKLLRFDERTSRTVSIETGMQNSALAVVLARSVSAASGGGPLASLPGALSATCHSCLGSLLAATWRLADGRKGNKNGEKEEV